MPRVALYASYSFDNRRTGSIDDQLRSGMPRLPASILAGPAQDGRPNYSHSDL